MTTSQQGVSCRGDAEAVQLAAVVHEDPNEEAARAEYLRLPGLQGAFLLLRPDTQASV